MNFIILLLIILFYVEVVNPFLTTSIWKCKPEFCLRVSNTPFYETSSFNQPQQQQLNQPAFGQQYQQYQQYDVSIDYDAAARVEYEAWVTKYQKEYDPYRYEIFKSNYEKITIANVKSARDRRKGKKARAEMAMNEYADMTKEEYMLAMGIPIPPPKATATQGMDIVEYEEDYDGNENYKNEFIDVKEFENLSFTSLEEEKLKLARQTSNIISNLGLKNMDELNTVMQTIDLITSASENVDNILERKAKIRTAYLDWCNDYNKPVDEKRFLIFCDNYEKFERYFEERGMSIRLNQYADCTETEYRVLRGQETVNVRPAKKESGFFPSLFDKSSDKSDATATATSSLSDQRNKYDNVSNNEISTSNRASERESRNFADNEKSETKKNVFNLFNFGQKDDTNDIKRDKKKDNKKDDTTDDNKKENSFFNFGQKKPPSNQSMNKPPSNRLDEPRQSQINDSRQQPIPKSSSPFGRAKPENINNTREKPPEPTFPGVPKEVSSWPPKPVVTKSTNTDNATTPKQQENSFFNFGKSNKEDEDDDTIKEDENAKNPFDFFNFGNKD